MPIAPVLVASCAFAADAAGGKPIETNAAANAVKYQRTPRGKVKRLGLRIDQPPSSAESSVGLIGAGVISQENRFDRGMQHIILTKEHETTYLAAIRAGDCIGGSFARCIPSRRSGEGLRCVSQGNGH